MSQNDQNDQFGQEKYDRWSSRLSNDSTNNRRKLQQQSSDSDYMIREMIQKSTYQQQKQSQMDVQQQQQNISKNILSRQQKQQKEEEYESISSDKSQQQQQQQKYKYKFTQQYVQKKQLATSLHKQPSIHNSSEYNKSTKTLQQQNSNNNNNKNNYSMIEDRFNKLLQKNERGQYVSSVNKNGNNKMMVDSQRKMLQQSIPISSNSRREANTQHATFNIQRGSNVKQTAQSVNSIKSIKSLSKQPQLSLSQNSTKPKVHEQYKYPSIEIKPIIANNSKKLNQISMSSSSSSSHVSIIKSKNSIKEYQKQKQINYALTMKKVTSDQSPKRSQSIEENKKLITSHQRKKQKVQQIICYDDEVDNDKKSILKQKQTKQPNMFYVSISGQQMYPSLDLKKDSTIINYPNTINLINHENLQPSISPMSKNNKDYTNNNNKMKKSQQKSFGNSQSSTLKLDPSLPYKIKISQYRSEYFLKVQTQVFTIITDYPPSDKDIQMKTLNTNKKTNPPTSSTPPPTNQSYSIQRRFSDFVFLYQSIVTNHLGYIIYPFPQKSIQSFVKIKLQSLIGNSIIMNDQSSQYESQKMQLIERRIQELQRFVNFLLQHQQLKYSQQLAIFLTSDQQLYVKSRERITKYIEEYKELQSSGNILQQGKKNIKKVIETGYGMVMRWWSTQNSNNNENISNSNSSNNRSSSIMISSTKKTTNNNATTINIPTTFKDQQQLQIAQQFNSYSNTVQTMYAKFHMLEKSLNRLVEMYQKIIGFKDIDTEFDYLMKLCAKVSSGKEYTKNMKIVVGEELLREVEVMRRWLEQVRGQLAKREQMKMLIQQLKSSLGYNADLTAKISKLQRRMDRFDKNFRFGFNNLIQQCEQTFSRSRTNFTNQWQGHCKNMAKIWK